MSESCLAVYFKALVTFQRSTAIIYCCHLLSSCAANGVQPYTFRDEPVVSNMYYFPPARWGLLDFMLVVRILLSSSFFLLLPRRASFASSWSQWASPDLICQLLIAVGLAGLHLPALDRGLQPARVGELWASPDFNRRDSARCGARRTSTDEIWRAVSLAGL